MMHEVVDVLGRAAQDGWQRGVLGEGATRRQHQEEAENDRAAHGGMVKQSYGTRRSDGTSETPGRDVPTSTGASPRPLPAYSIS